MINLFCLQVHFHENKTNFHKKDFLPGLVLKQRQKGTRKWPVACLSTLLLWLAQGSFHLSVEINSYLLWLCIQATPSDWNNKLRATFSTNQKLNQNKPIERLFFYLCRKKMNEYFPKFSVFFLNEQSYVFKRNAEACTGTRILF